MLSCDVICPIGNVDSILRCVQPPDFSTHYLALEIKYNNMHLRLLLGHSSKDTNSFTRARQTALIASWMSLGSARVSDRLAYQ